VNPHGSGQALSDASAPKACPSCGARYAADALFCSLDGAPLTTSPGAIAAAAANDYYLGREILGHIEIRQLVGLGAMGRVYRAFQRGIDRDVAVKVLHRELSANPTVVARFNREAKVAARLSHPNVVHVLLVGQLPDGAMYIVMEYLDGMSLQSALAAAGGALPLSRALHVAVQLCDAAGEAHGQGIVHRDLKPENIMLIERADDPDFVKVLDFGIARVSWGEPSMTTAAGLVFGTARYVSPEGAGGERVGPAGDVYSIATMVYQMLSGRTPFDADQAVALLVQQIHDAPPHLKSIARASYVPDPIAATVMKNLSKRPDERAESARAFGRALLEAAMASGLSVQDILARPSLLPGGRLPSTSIQMPSMQRTQQLSLEPGAAERMGGTVEGESRPVARTEIADPSVEPPGISTAKWAPPAALQTRLATPAASSKPPSAVEATLADAPLRVRDEPPSRRRLAIAGLVAAAVGVVVLGYKLVSSSTGAAASGGRRPAASAVIQETSPDEARRSAAEPSAIRAAPSSAQAEALPPLVTARQPPAGPPSSVPGASRVVIEASSAKPGIGQPVDLSARVSGGAGHARVDAPRFRITGPGIPSGTELPAVDDGTGVLRTTFTFLQGGRFDVTFFAHLDGAPVRSSRVILVGEPLSPPPAAPPSAEAPPATPPAPSAKWL
jgi:serine/threonine protein kinase